MFLKACFAFVRRWFWKTMHSRNYIRHGKNENVPMHVCAITAFVGWFSTESRQISSFHNFLSFGHYLENASNQCIKKCGYGNFNHDIMFFLFTCLHFWVWGILWKWSACALTIYDVVHDCQKFKKHCFQGRQRIPICTSIIIFTQGHRKSSWYTYSFPLFLG
jgi:hypothetical protein